MAIQAVEPVAERADSQQTDSEELEKLKQQLKKAEKEAKALQQQQAYNAAEQERLAQAIDAVGSNETEFGTGGDELRKQYKALSGWIGREIDCVKPHLGGHFKAIDDAVHKVTNSLAEEGDKIVELEITVSGALEIASDKARREAALSELAFDDLNMAGLATRVGDAKTLYEEADKIKGPSMEDAAAKYAILWLAKDRLRWTRLGFEATLRNEKFSFPEDDAEYSRQLLAAYEKMSKDNAEFAKSTKELEEQKTAIASALQSLETNRSERKNHTVEAAKEAAEQSAPKGRNLLD